MWYCFVLIWVNTHLRTNPTPNGTEAAPPSGSIPNLNLQTLEHSTLPRSLSKTFPFHSSAAIRSPGCLPFRDFDLKLEVAEFGNWHWSVQLALSMPLVWFVKNFSVVFWYRKNTMSWAGPEDIYLSTSLASYLDSEPSLSLSLSLILLYT